MDIIMLEWVNFYIKFLAAYLKRLLCECLRDLWSTRRLEKG